jgi:uncharacterized protein YdaU (DUF1376 family)
VVHWYKHDPDAFIAGTTELSLEEVGAYSLVIDLLYSRDGIVPDDDTFLCRTLRCHKRTWRKLKKSLIAKGKIWVTPDRMLMAKRVLKQLNELRVQSEIASSNARTGWQKRKNPNENSGGSMLSGNAAGNATRTRKKDTTSSFLGAAREAPEQPAGSLATAPLDSALARPLPGKPIHELSRDEVMEQRRKKAADRESAKGQVLNPPITLQ